MVPVARIFRCLMIAVAMSMAPAGHGLRPASYATYEFGLSLSTGLNNQLFTLFLVKVFEGRVIHSDPITREQFVLQAQGVVPSKANPAAGNLFRKYEVKACLADVPDTVQVHLMDCWVFDELWKLRLQEYPFRLMEGQHPGAGWAEKRDAPSPRQMLLLSDYGILQMSNLVHGEKTFHLLRDVGDSSWVDNYRKGY